MNEKYYVIGDIHGQSDLLRKALNYIYSEGGNKIIFLGDYIDRGPDSIGVMDILMSPPEGVNFITLMGNHESMMIETDFKSWYCNKFINQTNSYLPEKYRDFMKSLKLIHVEDNNIFAHAFIDTNSPLDQQLPSIVMWNRFWVGEDFKSDKYHLTHGHTPFRNGPEQLKNRTNLDCATKDGNQICVGIYEKGRKGPKEFVMLHADSTPSVRFPPYF